MNTIARGNAAEAAVLQAFAAAGVGVLIPFGNGLAFDLAVVMPGGPILRVQVKCGRVRNGCVQFNAATVYTGVLRLDAPRNNQRRRVRFAEDYAFERWLETFFSPRLVA